ncbi:uncharacterized protein LOC141575885 [Camelus bactrianus]|uniref:Uncharacterized protein LOC141575885 n=1 Tax=Camelus bactrianus TaxID=9837 RepID=A0AC58PTQ4_CAMBA
MLLHAPKKTSLRFSAPSAPSPASRRGRGGTGRPPAAPRAAAAAAAAAAAGTARGTERGAQPEAAAPDAPRRARPRRSESRSCRLPGRFPVPFRSFLSNTFAPPPPSSAPPSASPPRSARRCDRPRRPARAGARTAPRSPRGNFWTRWWCPLGEGEEGSPGRRGRGQSGGGGRGRSRAGPRRRRGRHCHPGSCGARGPNAGRRSRDRGSPEPGSGRGRAALERLELGRLSPTFVEDLEKANSSKKYDLGADCLWTTYYKTTWIWSHFCISLAKMVSQPLKVWALLPRQSSLLKRVFPALAISANPSFICSAQKPWGGF